MRDVIVVGGGVAGLTAAVDLSRKGFSTILVEERPHCGGRACSFTDRESGDILDNGQHILSGAYSAFFRLLRETSSEAELKWIDPLRLPFRLPGGIGGTLSLPALPIRFAFPLGLLRYRLLTLRQRLSVLRLAAKIPHLTDMDLKQLEEKSVYIWMGENSQDAQTIERFWNVVSLATLNADARDASAKLFAVVLKEIFFSGRDASMLIVPRSGLSALYVEPALRTLRAADARVVLHNGAVHVSRRDDGHFHVALRNGEELSGRAIVLAVPPDRLGKILNRNLAEEARIGNLAAFRTSEIRSYYFWSRHSVTNEPMTGLLATGLHWLFDKGVSRDGNRLYAGTMSGADREGETASRGALDPSEELRLLYPRLPSDSLARILRIRERRATILASPGTEALRPAARTGVPALFLAGDWTATGLPATLEGAVRSGYNAAREVRGMKNE